MLRWVNTKLFSWSGHFTSTTRRLYFSQILFPQHDSVNDIVAAKWNGKQMYHYSREPSISCRQNKHGSPTFGIAYILARVTKKTFPYKPPPPPLINLLVIAPSTSKQVTTSDYKLPLDISPPYLYLVLKWIRFITAFWSLTKVFRYSFWETIRGVARGVLGCPWPPPPW